MNQERCPVCLGDMEVPVYDEREEGEIEPIVEGGCTRLGCGHALHTQCMVQSLVSTQGKCVCCNMNHFNPDDHREMPWEQRLQFEKMCLDKLKTVKNSLLVKEGLRDYVSYKNELKQKHKEFKDRIEDFKKELRSEMKIEELIKTVSNIRTTTKKNFKKEMKHSTGLESAALLHISDWHLDRWLFNERGWQSRAIMVRGSRYGFY